MAISREQLISAMKVVEAVNEAIVEAGDRGLVLGPMYAHVMGSMSYDSFMGIIGLLEKAGKIRVSNHVAYRVKQR